MILAIPLWLGMSVAVPDASAQTTSVSPPPPSSSSNSAQDDPDNADVQERAQLNLPPPKSWSSPVADEPALRFFTRRGA